MTTTLTAAAQVAAGRRTLNRPALLADIAFTSPSAYTLRVAAEPLIVGGNVYLPLVASWGNVEEAVNVTDAGGKPGTATMTLVNSVRVDGTGKARLSDLVRTPLNTSGTYRFEFAKVTVKMLLDPSHVATDAVTLGVFYLEDPTEFDDELLTLRMSDVALMLEDKLDLVTISAADFPNADPDAVAHTIPAVFGVLPNLPCYAIVAGAVSTIAADLTASATSVTVTDMSRFPAVPFVAQIDDEQVNVTAKSSSAFTTMTRGYAGTTATAHAKGATVWEVRSGAQAYRWVVAENKGNYKVKSISNIQAGGVLQTSGFTLTMEDTTLIAGRSFVVINFSALPVVKRQVTVVDGIAVSDNIAISASSGTTESRQATNTPLTIRATWTGNTAGTATVSGTITMPSTTLTPNSVNIQVQYQITETNTCTAWSFSHSGTVIESGTSFPALGTRVVNYSRGATYGNETFTLSMTVPTGAPGSITIVIQVYTANINGTTSVTKTGNAFRTGAISGNSTADVIVGDLTCDVEGLKDDVAGTVSGTPSLLLENPADIVKCALLACYGTTIIAGDLGSIWASTRASLAAAAYKWALPLGANADDKKFSTLRRRFSEQAQSALYVDRGLVEYKYLTTPVSADVTLNYLSDVWVEVPARVSRTLRTEIRNMLAVYSQRDFRKSGTLGDQYLRTTNTEDLTDFADRLRADVELDFVQDATTATALAAYWLAWRKRQRFLVQCVTWQNVAAVDVGDVIAISNHPTLSAHGALLFRVVSKKYRVEDPHPGRIELNMIEANA